MARVSTRENKNIYQLTRENLKLTRETASELLESIPPERIEKIESGRSFPQPDEWDTDWRTNSCTVPAFYISLQLLLRQSVSHRAGVCAGDQDQGPVSDRAGNAGIFKRDE